MRKDEAFASNGKSLLLWIHWFGRGVKRDGCRGIQLATARRVKGFVQVRAPPEIGGGYSEQPTFRRLSHTLSNQCCCLNFHPIGPAQSVASATRVIRRSTHVQWRPIVAPLIAVLTHASCTCAPLRGCDSGYTQAEYRAMRRRANRYDRKTPAARHAMYCMSTPTAGRTAPPSNPLRGRHIAVAKSTSSGLASLLPRPLHLQAHAVPMPAEQVGRRHRLVQCQKLHVL